MDPLIAEQLQTSVEDILFRINTSVAFNICIFLCHKYILFYKNSGFFKKFHSSFSIVVSSIQS